MEAAEKFELIKSLKNQLDEYIQKKADFLAEITTEPLATTKSAFFYRDVIIPFITNTLLTDNLARNEGIGYTNLIHNRLRIRVIIKGKELRAHFVCSEPDHTQQNIRRPEYIYPESLPYTLRCIHQSKQPPGVSESSLCNNPAHASIIGNDGTVLQIVNFEHGDQDVEIELPGPLGEYAFYAFLENLIRNSAKHNKEIFDADPGRELEIVIRLSEPKDELKKKDFYAIEIFDTVSDPNLSLEASGENQKTLLDLIEQLLKQRIIDKVSANLLRQAWGIAEMKICAMLLKGIIDFEDLEKCLKVGVTEWEDKKSHLAYRFDAMKPKRLCAVAPSLFAAGGISGERRKTFEQRGILVFEDFAALEDYVQASSSIASFGFLLLDYHNINGADSKKLEEAIHKLPFRIVISHSVGAVLSNELKQLVDCGAAVVTHEVAPYEKEPAEIISWLWRVWLSRWLKKDQEAAIVEVFLDQEQDLSPSKEWIAHAKTFNEQSGNGIVKLRVSAKDSKGNAFIAAGDPNWQGRRIFFDRHGGALSSLTTDENFLGKHTYVFLDKLNSDFVRIFHPTFGDNWLLPYELAEAGLLSVLVVDERIAERCLQQVEDANTLSVADRFTGDPFGPLPLTWHLAFGAKLYIATHFGFKGEPKPLHKESYEQAASRKNALLPFLKVKVEETNQAYQIAYEWSPNGEENVSRKLDVDALIIHQGILDPLNKNKSEEFLRDLLAKIRHNIPFVVVDSGRGIPPSLPSTAKFLPFSVLQDYVAGKRPAKYGLTQVTMGLTRRQQEV